MRIEIYRNFTTQEEINALNEWAETGGNGTVAYKLGITRGF